MADGNKRPRVEGGGDGGGGGGNSLSSYTYATRYAVREMPKFEMPENGYPAAVARQLIDDERRLDSNPALNLASFVTTWMEPEAEEIMRESFNVNAVDVMQYPSCTEIHNRCVSILADLFHAEGRNESAMGTATIGSSEAIMLAGLSMKFKWKKRMQALGKDTSKPNLVMGYHVQVCWEKFCRYWEVEARFVDVESDPYTLDADKALALVDENTIGIAAILGSTYTGAFDDVKVLNDKLAALNASKGLDVRIHVDGASGAFVAPFLYPDLQWDFRLPLVTSINASGHKYGLVFPGVGWLVFRNAEAMSPELAFHTNYLGSDQPSITLNFSKPASAVLGQYFVFLRLGKQGYAQVMQNLNEIAHYLRDKLVETGHFKILSKDVGVPLVAISLLPGKDGKNRFYDEFQLSDRLRQSGWTLPAYTMPPSISHVKLLRAVIREDFSRALADKLVADMNRAIDYLDHHFCVTEEQVKEYGQHVVDDFLGKGPHIKPPKKSKFNGVC